MERSLEAIKAKCEVNEDGCWIWQACAINGVPKANFEGTTLCVRRPAFELSGKKLVKGKYIITKCRQELCVCPSHLKQVNRVEHAQILAKRKGGASVNVFVANRLMIHTRVTSILNAEKAQEIRVSYQDGGVTQDQLALKYGVSRSAIGAVIRAESWVPRSASAFNPFALLGAR